MSMSRI